MLGLSASSSHRKASMTFLPRAWRITTSRPTAPRMKEAMKASEPTGAGFGEGMGGYQRFSLTTRICPLFYGANFWGDFVWGTFLEGSIIGGTKHWEVSTYFTEKKPPLLLGSPPFFVEVGGQ